MTHYPLDSLHLSVTHMFKCLHRRRGRPKRQLKRLYPDTQDDSQPDVDEIDEEGMTAADRAKEAAQEAEDAELLAPVFKPSSSPSRKHLHCLDCVGPAPPAPQGNGLCAKHLHLYWQVIMCMHAWTQIHPYASTHTLAL